MIRVIDYGTLSKLDGDWLDRALRVLCTDPDLGFSLEHLRILTGPVCFDCWRTEGEIVPATEHVVYLYGPSCDLCDRHADPEPGDQGVDDGPLSFAERCEVEARELRGIR